MKPIPFIDSRGIISQNNSSPKGSFILNPFTRTDKPCGTPTNGEAEYPLKRGHPERHHSERNLYLHQYL